MTDVEKHNLCFDVLVILTALDATGCMCPPRTGHQFTDIECVITELGVTLGNNGASSFFMEFIYLFVDFILLWITVFLERLKM